MSDLSLRAHAAFRTTYGCEPALLVQAPGRLNLIGEHTDYNDGFVLPCAIDRGTVIAIGRSTDDCVHAVASDAGGERDSFGLGKITFDDRGGWTNHVRGVVATMAANGHAVRGARLAIAGDIPQGAGLSSSASLGVGLALAFATLESIDLDARALARIAQQSENDFVGCACGIMDQLVATSARAGHALMIDCRTLEAVPVPIGDGIGVMAIHSGISRGLVDSAYNQRRVQCAAAARHYGVTALRDLDVERLEAHRDGLDDIAFRRARHVVTENARVVAAVRALATGDLGALGRLMARSHASMRDDFEITLPVIDRIVAVAAETMADEGGARMTGGGFGGCVVVVGRKDRLSRVAETMANRVAVDGGAPPFVLHTVPSGGASVLID